MAGQQNIAGACAPGCTCGKPPSRSKTKMAISLGVMLAAVLITGYKLIGRPADSTAPAPADFTAAGALVPPPPVAAGSPAGARPSGAVALESLGALNTLALDKDAVFVFIPDQKGAPLPGAADSAAGSARAVLESKGVRLGVYALRAGTSEHKALDGKIPAPAWLVMSKGKGMGLVSGEATPEKFLQAFVASNQAGGGCGPKQCGPGGAAAGCGPKQ